MRDRGAAQSAAIADIADIAGSEKQRPLNSTPIWGDLGWCGVSALES